jgi:MFS family permease
VRPPTDKSPRPALVRSHAVGPPRGGSAHARTLLFACAVFYTRVKCCGLDGGPMLDNVVGYGTHTIDLRVTAKSCECNLNETFGEANFPEDGSFAPCAVPFISKDSAMWSHSKYCSNYAYVQMETQTAMAVWGGLLGLSAIIWLPAMGKVADIYGRRQIFYWTTLLTCCTFVILAVDAAFRFDNNYFVWTTAPLLSSSAIHAAIGWTMIIDLVPDPIDQAVIFPLVTPILQQDSKKNVASICGDLVSYFILALHIDDYTTTWVVLTLVAAFVMVFIWFLVPETMANPKPWPGVREFLRDILPLEPCCRGGGGGEGSAPVPDSTGYGAAVWCRGPDEPGSNAEGAAERKKVMNAYLAIQFLIHLSNGVQALDGNMMLGPMHFKQEERIYVSLVSKAFVVIGAAVGAVTLPKYGPWKNILAGCILAVMGPLTYAILPGQIGGYLKPMLLNSGASLVQPAGVMYIAAVMPPEDLARTQGMLFFFTTIANALGPVYTVVYYGAGDLMREGYAFAAVR